MWRDDVTTENRARWLAFTILCLGSFMIVLDTTIVNVALPSIREDLGFTEASLAAGISSSQTILIAARAAQGLGGAIVSAAGLSLMMGLFTEPAERAKAMGIVGFISAGGGSVGVLLGGILTSFFGWQIGR